MNLAEALNSVVLIEMRLSHESIHGLDSIKNQLIRIIRLRTAEAKLENNIVPARFKDSLQLARNRMYLNNQIIQKKGMESAI